MSDSKIFIGVDIGTSKIVTVIAQIDENINIIGVSEIKSVGIKKGQIVDIENAVNSIIKSLEAAERMAGYGAKNVFVSVGGSHIESQNSNGTVAVSSKQVEITQNDIDRVIDSARAVTMPSYRQIIHVLPRNFTVDGQEGIKDPISMTGYVLKVDAHIITANITNIRNIERALNEAGVNIDNFVSIGYASSLAVLTDTEKELGIVLVDIGSGTTSICIYIDGSVSFSSVIPIGARHITSDLALGLRISTESAEKIKIHLSGCVVRKTIRPDDLEGLSENKIIDKSDELDISLLDIPEELKKISKKTLIEGIIRPRLNEIFTMVGLEIKRSGYGGKTPAGLVVTGGGSNTVAMTEAAKRMLLMPVRIGNPKDLKGIVDEADDPSFSAVIGLCIFASKKNLKSENTLPFSFSLSNIQLQSFYKFFKKITNLIKSLMP